MADTIEVATMDAGFDYFWFVGNVTQLPSGEIIALFNAWNWEDPLVDIIPYKLSVRVFSSFDDGVTWTEKTKFYDRYYWQDPLSYAGGKLFAGNYGPLDHDNALTGDPSDHPCVAYSTDAGLTWSGGLPYTLFKMGDEIAYGDVSYGAGVIEVANGRLLLPAGLVHSGTGTTLYNNYCLSDDGGVTWTPMIAGDPGPGITLAAGTGPLLSMFYTGDQRIVSLPGSASSGAIVNNYVLISTDNGALWVKSTFYTGTTRRLGALRCVMTTDYNGTFLIAGGIGVFLSVDSGESWSDLTAAFQAAVPDYIYPEISHPIVQVVLCDADRWILICNSAIGSTQPLRCLYVTEDRGVTYRALTVPALSSFPGSTSNSLGFGQSFITQNGSIIAAATNKDQNAFVGVGVIYRIRLDGWVVCEPTTPISIPPHAHPTVPAVGVFPLMTSCDQECIP